MPFPVWAGRGSCCAVSRLREAPERLYLTSESEKETGHFPRALRKDLEHTLSCEEPTC